jgi:1,4-dihydroxy-6-naphthoate synthase
MKLTLGFSPCPNDTFIFDALVHQRVDTEGLEFEVQLADVEALNQGAFQGDLDITKLSYHAFAYVADNYMLLHSGSALGNNCGPLLIARSPVAPEAVPGLRIAIPGKYTTANFLLGLAFPEARHTLPLLFSDIEDAVVNGSVDAGLIIHENRFTYAGKGLVKIMDLGEFWEQTTGMPIPLGGIAVRRNLPLKIRQKINRVLHRSVAFALDNPTASREYVRCHAQEMDEQVMYSHIALYVNDYTRDLGDNGRAAVRLMFEKAHQKGLIPILPEAIFLENEN